MDRFAALVKSGPLFIICQGNSTPYRSQKLNRKLRRRGEQSYFSLSTYLLQIGHFLHFPLGCLRLSWQLRTMWVTVEHFRSILRAGWAGGRGTHGHEKMSLSYKWGRQVTFYTHHRCIRWGIRQFGGDFPLIPQIFPPFVTSLHWSAVPATNPATHCKYFNEIFFKFTTLRQFLHFLTDFNLFSFCFCLKYF